MVKDSQSTVGDFSSGSAQAQSAKGSVGIVSASGTALREVAGLLARQGVGLSQAIRIKDRDPSPSATDSAMLAGLRTCQIDPATEIIVLISKMLSPEAADRVLAGVRESEKPTVVCFFGIDPRLLWRAGAIPAVRLDEAALRAVAWVRGWDQALISSQLEDLDEQLATLATDLRARLDPNRRLLRGLFNSTLFFQEAQTILSGAVGEGAQFVRLELWAKGSTQDRLSSLKSALDDPETAVVLLDGDAPYAPASDWVDILRPARTGPVVIAYVSGYAEPPHQHAAREKALRAAGVILAASSAAAARLSGMIVGPPGRLA